MLRCFLVGLLLLLSQSAWATCAHDYLGETCTYKFELVEGAELGVCQHITGELNSRFTRFMDLSGFSEQEKAWTNARLPLELRYPSSADFEAIRWQMLDTFTEGERTYALPVAKVDIDNDGTKEVVIQTGFNGDGRTTETLVIFRHGTLDLNHPISRRELLTGHPNLNQVPSILAVGLRIRLFEYQNVVYVLNYVAQEPDTKRATRMTHQRMEVLKYLGGGRLFKSPIPLRLEHVCEYQMRRLIER